MKQKTLITVENKPYMKTQRFVSIKQYSKMCGVSRQTIYNWISINNVVAVKKSYGWIIDLGMSGVKKASLGGRKSISDHIAQEGVIV